MNNTSSNFIFKILEDACVKQASDIHFYPDEHHVSIFYRLYGVRTHISTISLKLYKVLLSYMKFTANMDIAEQRKPQDGIFSFTMTTGAKYSLRLSTLPMNQLESLSIRLIPLEQIPILENLLLFPYQIQALQTCVSKNSGMLILSGPTGSGKSTTMYALIEYLVRKNAYQVITLEDPVERKLDTIIQVEINEKAGITYQSGLKAALRHDPDILLIGEIRDVETAKYAIRAALTGHLVLTTVHAKNAVSTIDRMLEFGISRHELEQTLIAIGAIQLINVVKGHEYYRRGAIIELLTEQQLQQLFTGQKIQSDQKHSFKYLTEKAYFYGFTSEI